MTMPSSRTLDDSQGGDVRAVSLFIAYLNELPLQSWVLVRPRLSADDFATLYAPFEPVIPSALLFGLPK